jgi:hypothetical protein
MNDKLKILMNEEFRTSLQLVVLNIPTTHVSVNVQQTQIKPSLVTNLIQINQHLLVEKPYFLNQKFSTT